MRCCMWTELRRNLIAKDTVAQPAAVTTPHLLRWHGGQRDLNLRVSLGGARFFKCKNTRIMHFHSNAQAWKKAQFCGGELQLTYCMLLLMSQDLQRCIALNCVHSKSNYVASVHLRREHQRQNKTKRNKGSRQAHLSDTNCDIRVKSRSCGQIGATAHYWGTFSQVDCFFSFFFFFSPFTRCFFITTNLDNGEWEELLLYFSWIL